MVTRKTTSREKISLKTTEGLVGSEALVNIIRKLHFIYLFIVIVINFIEIDVARWVSIT